MAWDGWHGKIARIGVLLFALVSLASYTASLTAFFTQDLWALVGPQTSEQLSQTTCVSNVNLLRSLGETIGAAIHAPPELLQRGGSTAAWEWW